jgi:hypothetical protein
MSTELAIYAPGTLDAKVEYCKLLSDSGLLPDAYRGKPANVLYALEYGEVLGVPAMAAITGIHIIKGKPSASAGLVGALVRKAGHKLRVKGDDTSARAVIIRTDDPGFEFVSEWTLDRAVTAKLCTLRDGKPYARDSKGDPTSWEKYPAAMLKHRAVTEVARDACEEVLFGLHYTPEELGAEVDEEGLPVVVQVPESAPAAAAPQLRVPQPARPRPVAGVERSRGQQDDGEFEQPAPTEQIDEAEIVPDADAWDSEDGRRRMAKLHALIGQKYGPMTDERRHAGFSKFTGRTITSAKDLTFDEADRFCAALREQPDYVPEEVQQQRARAEAEKLAATDEPDADRIEAAHRDAIESAESAGQVHEVELRIQFDVAKGLIGTVARDLLLQAAKRKKDQFAADAPWTAGVSRQMDGAAA